MGSSWIGAGHVAAVLCSEPQRWQHEGPFPCPPPWEQCGKSLRDPDFWLQVGEWR